ncbi:MAG: CopG family transcriptional regulator [Chloroflexi bacterium]|nr:CopG family transcriptional regulator [Chloroflexota bacterium]
MGEHKAAKITISLPKELLDFADHLAIEQSTSRSGVFARLLEKEEEARVQALMAKGYSEMGEENRQEAEEALNLTNAVVLRDG